MSAISWLERFSGPILRYLGVDFSQRGTMEFAGSGVVVTDDANNDKTLITISAGGSTPTGSGFRKVVAGVEQAAAASVSLTADVAGTLPVANGGTGQTALVSAIAALAINWGLAPTFTKTLGAGSNTFTFSGQVAGQVIVVRLTGAASTVTWPTVKWAGGVAPTQTASGTDVYTFFYDGTSTYGSVVQAMA
jgi:hypothetical protein